MLAAVRTESAHTFLIVSDNILRRRQSDYRAGAVWSCNVVQRFVLKHLKINSANKPTPRCEVYITVFLTEKNFMPQCFLLLLSGCCPFFCSWFPPFSFLILKLDIPLCFHLIKAFNFSFLSSFRFHSSFPSYFFFLYLIWTFSFLFIFVSVFFVSLCSVFYFYFSFYFLLCFLNSPSLFFLCFLIHASFFYLLTFFKLTILYFSTFFLRFTRFSYFSFCYFPPAKFTIINIIVVIIIIISICSSSSLF